MGLYYNSCHGNVLKRVFNLYMLLCENNAPKQMSVHSSTACYVHVIPYKAAERMFTC
jgi:hypothetical protein